jgi:hypothetical protein
MIGEIQALIDRGVASYKLSEKGGVRTKAVARPISATGKITDRRLLIKDADIAKLSLSALALRGVKFGYVHKIAASVIWLWHRSPPEHV